MPDTDEIRSLVRNAIDEGASTVEEVHRAIAALPLNALKSVSPDLGGSVEDLVNKNISLIYDTIRSVNEQVDQIAQQLLSKASSDDGAASG